MKLEQSRPVHSQPTGSAFAMWVGFACALLGGITLTGWYANLTALRDLGPWSVAMRPVSALAPLACGLGMSARSLMRAPRVSRALGAACSALGVLGFVDRVD